MTHYQLLSPLLLLFLFILHLPRAAHAHGYVTQISIDGKLYYGNAPNAQPTPAIVRQVSTVDPVKNASNPNLNCGQNAIPATLVADANPGSTLQFWWKGGDGSNWPHNWGPIMSYMASCSNTTCDKYNSVDAAWFKIEETGLQPGNALWYQQNMMSGSPSNVTIPSTLAPGQYLVRHEIIALHLATQMYGAEFYPSCTQLNIHGSQSGAASSTEEVTFPGGYSDTDPGIYDPTVYDIPVQYTFPGPSVAEFVTAASSPSSGAGSSSISSSPPTSTSPGSAVSTPTSSGVSGASCKLLRQGGVLERRHPHPLLHPPRWVSRIVNVLVGSG